MKLGIERTDGCRLDLSANDLNENRVLVFNNGNYFMKAEGCVSVRTQVMEGICMSQTHVVVC